MTRWQMVDMILLVPFLIAFWGLEAWRREWALRHGGVWR